MLSLSNPNFDKYVDQIYPPELDIKNTTESARSTSYLDLLLNVDANKILHTKLYDKRDDFNFPIVNFPFLDSNIPASPAYGVFISQLIRYSRASSEYIDFLARGKLLTSKLLCQGFKCEILIVAIKKMCGRSASLTDFRPTDCSMISSCDARFHFMALDGSVSWLLMHCDGIINCSHRHNSTSISS